MAIALVVVSVALAVCLYLLLLGKKDAPVASRSSSGEAAPAAAGSREDFGDRARKAEKDLEKRVRELDEQKKVANELKDELKQLKKKLHGQKEASKADDDLVKARAEVERTASIQLESTRAELATALADLTRLKAEAENKGRRSAPAPVAAPVAAAEGAAPEVRAEKPQMQVTRVIRELSDADREQMQRYESQAAEARKKAIDLEKEVRNLKGKVETQNRQLKTSRAEQTLAQDKFRAVEKRLNRTLLLNELVTRAIRALEKQTGVAAERVELTQEELNESDKKIEGKQQEEAKAAADAEAKLEAQEAAAAAGEPAPAAPAEAPVNPTANA